VPYPGRQRLTAGAAALLAACGVLGVFPPAGQASAVTSAPTWTKQATAHHPSAREAASMAYDAATGTVVLFGGVAPGAGFMDDDTWIWG